MMNWFAENLGTIIITLVLAGGCADMRLPDRPKEEREVLLRL
jgi:hypothetical protein